MDDLKMVQNDHREGSNPCLGTRENDPFGGPQEGVQNGPFGGPRGSQGVPQGGVGTIRCRIADKMTPKWVILGQKGGFGGPNPPCTLRQGVLFAL